MTKRVDNHCLLTEVLCSNNDIILTFDNGDEGILRLENDEICLITDSGLDTGSMQIASTSIPRASRIFLQIRELCSCRDSYTYSIRWLFHCDDHDVSLDEDRVRRVDLIYSSPFSSCIIEQIEQLQGIDCGSGWELDVRIRGEGVNPALPSISLSFLKKGEPGVSIQDILPSLIVKSNAVISSISTSPISCYDIGVWVEGQSQSTYGDLLYGRIDKIRNNGFGVIDLSMLQKISWRRVFTDLTRKDLSPFLYWRAFCQIDGIDDGVPAESKLSLAYGCIESLYQRTSRHQEKGPKRSDEFRAFINDLDRLASTRTRKEILEFIRAQEKSYVCKDALSDKILYVFDKDTKNIDEQKYARLSNKLRNNLSHGRTLTDGLSQEEEDLVAPCIAWLRSNLRKTMIDFVACSRRFSSAPLNTAS